MALEPGACALKPLTRCGLSAAWRARALVGSAQPDLEEGSCATGRGDDRRRGRHGRQMGFASTSLICRPYIAKKPIRKSRPPWGRAAPRPPPALLCFVPISCTSRRERSGLPPSKQAARRRLVIPRAATGVLLPGAMEETKAEPALAGDAAAAQPDHPTNGSDRGEGEWR